MNKVYALLLFVLLISVNALALTPITGTLTVCAGSTTTLSNATPGGTWMSGDVTIATVGSSTGIVTGVAAGTVSIGYSTSSGVVAVIVTVNPLPTLSSSLTPPTICDSFIFNYTPTSGTPGTTFAWSRATIAGIVPAGASGIGNPNEQLVNNTPFSVSVVYVYTLTAGSCVSTQNVTVVVNPLPMLSSTLTPPDICDSALFTYAPTSATPGVAFTWNRPAVAGILPPTAFSTGGINERLDNTTTAPVVVTYFYRLSVGACINLFNESVSVTVGTCHVGVNNLSKLDAVIKIYPNPASRQFTIELSANRATITILDLTGRIIQTRTVETGSPIKESFDLSGVSPGTYFIKAISGESTYMEKLTIW